MAITDGDLKKIGKLMDERLLVFHEEVTDRKFAWLEEKFNKHLTELKEEVRQNTEAVAKIERKLDQVTDHQAEKLDDHEKRIGKLELSVAV